MDIAILQFFNGSDSSFLDGLMLTLTSGFTWVPLYIALLYLVVSNNDNMSKIVLIIGSAFLCVLLSGGVCDYIVKPLVGRLRPINDPVLYGIVRNVGNLSNRDFSFFSSHAANTTTLTVFFSLLVRDRKLAVAMSVWALTNCVTRLYLGMHFPSDIITGIIWGALAGLLVYCLYLHVSHKMFPDTEYISTQYTSKGYTIMTIDVAVLTLVGCYLYAILRSFLTCA